MCFFQKHQPNSTSFCACCAKILHFSHTKYKRNTFEVDLMIMKLCKTHVRKTARRDVFVALMQRHPRADTVEITMVSLWLVAIVCSILTYFAVTIHAFNASMSLLSLALWLTRRARGPVVHHGGQSKNHQRDVGWMLVSTLRPWHVTHGGFLKWGYPWVPLNHPCIDGFSIIK